MKRITVNKNEGINIDGKVTLTLEDGEDGTVIISIESEQDNDDFIKHFLGPDNVDIDLESIITLLKDSASK